MIPVVLSGGSGTRLWPVSRAKYPKQFCDLFSDSLQNLALKRLIKFGKPWVLTGQHLKDFTESQARSKGIEIQPLYEPFGRNTAPAMAFLLRVLQCQGRLNEVVGIFPADQLIEKESAFHQAVTVAAEAAAAGQIVTLGIKPTYPATGFGYIQVSSSNLNQAHDVQKFHEKPALNIAEGFLKSGNYFWNAGIFIFKAEVMLEAFKRLQPEVWNIASEIKTDLSNLKAAYEKFPNISVDFAIMEKLNSSQLSCVPCDIGWSDVGSWDAVADIYSKSEVSSQKDVVQVAGKNNFVFPRRDKNYSFVGVEDLIVVDTADALLVTKKGTTQEVKQVVDRLNEKKDPVTQVHVFEERPWGKFEILRDTERFKSKVIVVQPGAQLSLQSHTKREEHWIITQGSGEVVLNDQVIPVKSGTYVHIPLGAKHRMRNTGTQALEFIEVQLGSYFGEDDITRYQDDYGR
jgi:mannose-1-phosphate guanylyltransferase/mannose-6-phosphate isomerase